MENIYYNNHLSKEENREFEYIKMDEISKYFGTCYLVIKDLWDKLYNNKELVYKIIKYAKKEELNKTYLNIFFIQNFYTDLSSNSNQFPYELYYIIQKLINDIISEVKKITEYCQIFKESNLAYLLDGMVLNDKIRSYFNLILSDIIEQYENSEESMQILLFKVKEIKDYFVEQEEKIGLNSKKSEITKIKKRQNSILSKIYRMKFPNPIKSDNSLNDTFIELDYDETINKDYKNNEVFATRYLQELNKNDIIELLKTEKNEYMKNYIRNQLSKMTNDKYMYSNKTFLENVNNSDESVKILYAYQKNFMITISIIKKIITKLNENIEIIPEEIRIVCIMIMLSIKKKFDWISNNEVYIYISEFLMRLLKAYFLSPDFNTLITSVILSKNSKKNFKKIYEILLKLMSGDFYQNTKEESDYTPYNLFFLEINLSFYNFFEKLLNSDNLISKIQSIETILNNKKKNSHSNIYNIHQLAAILNIINHNYDKFFPNKTNDNNINEINGFKDEFLTIFEKLKGNKEIFTELKNKEKERKKIFYFAYNEVIYSPRILDIINRNQNKYFKIDELKDDQTTEVVNLNKIIRAKNLIVDLLYVSPKLNKLTNIASNSEGKDTKEILIHLNKYFKSLSIYNENENKNKLNTDNIINNEQSKIPKDWYINSLMICLENLDNEYSKNDYEKLYMSIKDDLIKSIKNYDFGLLTQILKELKMISLYKSKFINLKEKYKDIIINIKIRNIIENEPLEVLIKFIYNDNEKIFNITKCDNNSNNDIKDKSLKKCVTITDFIKYFPNLSLIQQKQDIDLFLIEREINLSNGLNQYFDLLITLINAKFNKEEKNIVFNKIQKYILIKIYDKIYPRESDKDDTTIFTKTVLLSWVRPHHFCLDKTYLDNFIPITTSYINQLDIEKSPNGKFNLINKIFNAINNILKFNKGCSFSIDDIAPICEYCLIKARPERLSSNIKYLQNFISNDMSDLRKMRFDIMKNCMNSIKDINYTKFEGISQKEFNELCNMAAREE